MAGTATTTRDVIRDMNDMDDEELAAAFKRWLHLSELVAPWRDEGAPAEADRPGRSGGQPR